MPETAPSVQQLLGVPSEIPCGETVYKFGPPTQGAKAHLEELFAAAAIEEAVGRERVLSPVAFKKYFDGVLARLDAKGYATGGDGWLSMIQSPAGQELFLLSLFRVNHSTMTLAEMRTVAERSPHQLQAALVRQVPGFFDLAFPGLTSEQRQTLYTITTAAISPFLPPSPSDDSPPTGTAN